MPVESHGPNGGTTITGNAILGMRALTVFHAMRMYLETNGKLQLTRVATPSNMRRIASEFTGKHYARSRKGLKQAYADLGKLLHKNSDLDHVGEVAQVNKLVGGVASDLSQE